MISGFRGIKSISFGDDDPANNKMEVIFPVSFYFLLFSNFVMIPFQMPGQSLQAASVFAVGAVAKLYAYISYNVLPVATLESNCRNGKYG
jgi:hypothetical protein